MTDVVEIANERRTALAVELGRLDFFLRMAEQLVKDNRLESNKASDTEDETAAESTVPATVRPYSAAADGTGADSEHEDLPVRELEAGEREGNSRTIHNEPSPDRPRRLGLFRQGAT